MTRTHHESLLAFLQGELDPDAHEAFLAEIERSPSLAEEVQRAAIGLEAVQAWADGVKHLDVPASPVHAPRSIPRWWLPLAMAASVVATVPATIWATRAGASGQVEGVAFGQPVGSDPSFVVVLLGRWPDAGGLSPDETSRRAAEYWAWTDELAESGVLMAAGDLRWESGLRVGPAGTQADPPADALSDPDFLVGMYAIRASSYDEALAIARECPHLRYGGSVSVRQVGAGFVTVSGRDDWAE